VEVTNVLIPWYPISYLTIASSGFFFLGAYGSLPDAAIRVILNGQIRVRRGWGGGGAWCGGGVVEARRTQGTRQLEV
jgi:hypothetical protein